MMIGLIDTSISILLARMNEAIDSIDTICLTVQSNYLFRVRLPIIKNEVATTTIVQNKYEKNYGFKGY